MKLTALAKIFVLSGERVELEYRFAPPRLWRFDFAMPARKIALEVEGGVWSAGRHVRGAGYLSDMDKYNCAAIMGWIVVRVAPKGLADGRAVILLDGALAMRDGTIAPEEAVGAFPVRSRRKVVRYRKLRLSP